MSKSLLGELRRCSVQTFVMTPRIITRLHGNLRCAQRSGFTAGTAGPRPCQVAVSTTIAIQSVPQQATSCNGLDLGWRDDFSDEYTDEMQLIGTGSFGQIHVGFHQLSGQPVAIKTLKKDRSGLTRDKTLERISREADMLARLQAHKGVVRLYGCFEDDGNVYIVTELCQGGDLQNFVEAHGPLDEASLALVAWEVLKVIKACHDLGILHGDIKPANFCLKEAQHHSLRITSAASNLRAIDFGTSQFIGSQRMTKRIGTPAYMAPEIFARDYGHAVDMWGMGVMLYWLFSRKFPFFDDVDKMQQAPLDEIAAAICNAPITYDFGPWQEMSYEGTNFIQRCLTRPEAERLTVEEALHHPWFDQFISEQELNAVASQIRQAEESAWD